MKKLTTVAAGSAAALIASIALAACGGETAAEGFKPCMVSDAGGFDDHSFNQLSFEGLQDVAKDFDLGDEGDGWNAVESQSDADYAPNIDSLVGEGCSDIVTVGFNLSAATVDAAKANPDIDFILIDDAADNDFDGAKDAENIKPLLYDTAQAAFLAGYVAAGYSKTGIVGTYGGAPYPTVTIFMDGFAQGVAYYNEQKGTDVKVVGWDSANPDAGSFTGGFENNNVAAETAKAILDQGADVILPVGGPIYLAALDAIKDSGKDIALIGVDADVYLTDPNTDPYILTSIQKNMKVSTVDALTAAANGEFDATQYVGTLENGGVGLAPFHDFDSKVSDDLKKEVEDVQKGIIDGSIQVTSYLNQ